MSKIESGMFEIVEDEYNVQGLLDEISLMACTRLKDKQVEFKVEIKPGFPEHLIGDKTRIKQILVNLVGNATKFTEEGYMILHADSKVENDRICVKMQVEDTGIGIKNRT